MTPLDVHFNYAPIEGKITKMVKTQAKTNLPMVDLWEYVNVTYFRRAIDVFSAKYRLINERLTFLIEGSDISVATVEIADKFVNKITAYVNEGDNLELGQKTSFIERGSQVDLIIFSNDIKINVKVGDQTYGGQTPIALY